VHGARHLPGGRRLGARLGQFFFDTLVGGRQLGLGFVSRSQAVGDLAGTLVQRSRDGRPHELHREQHKQSKDDGSAPPVFH
jgi:hypothetical protein